MRANKTTDSLTDLSWARADEKKINQQRSSGFKVLKPMIWGPYLITRDHFVTKLLQPPDDFFFF